jgi:hypothetical protein
MPRVSACRTKYLAHRSNGARPSTGGSAYQRWIALTSDDEAVAKLEWFATTMDTAISKTI